MGRKCGGGGAQQAEVTRERGSDKEAEPTHPGTVTRTSRSGEAKVLASSALFIQPPVSALIMCTTVVTKLPSAGIISLFKI